MVSSDRGYPDPENPQDELSPNDEIVMVTDTDTDEDDNPYNDYQPLPMHEVPDTSDDEVGINSDSEGAVGINNEEALPSITTMEEILVKEVWSGSAPKAVDIEMDKDKVDEVKQAMKNITLPPSSIPEWANNIPEEQWKQQLINKLQQK